MTDVWCNDIYEQYKKNNKKKQNEFKYHIIIYTDGCSKNNPGIGGYGAVLLYKTDNNNYLKKEISQGYKKTTNNRMEMMAVIMSLKQIKYNSYIELYSDSKYVVDAFNKKWVDSWLTENFRENKKNKIKNIDLWQILLEEVVKHKIDFFWVKGHNGNEYNELCDTLANDSLKNDLITDTGFEEKNINE